MKIMRCICLLLALVLCIGSLPPMTLVQAAENMSKSSSALPKSLDDFYMHVAIACRQTHIKGSPYRVLQVFPTDYNYPIVGVKLVFEYERDVVGFNATDSIPRYRFDEAMADSNRDSKICVGTVTGISEEPITFLEQGLLNLYFGRSPFAAEDMPFDFRITEFIIYVPLADGTVAEYTPDYPAEFHVPLMDDGSYSVHLGPKQTALSKDWIAWGIAMPKGSSIWKLQQDGTLIFEGITDIPSFTADEPAPWLQYRDQIKKVVMRDGMQTIGAYAFYGCTNLEEIVFPSRYFYPNKGQFFIYESAFEGCTSLTKLSSLPTVEENSTLIISSRAFARTALKTFHVPARVKIDYDAFAENYNLTHFTVDPNTMYSVDQWGALIVSSSTKYAPLHIFPKDMQGEYHIPFTQRDLREETFANCRGLTKIVLSDLNQIEPRVFRNCSVQEVYFPEGAPRIAQDAFENVTATVYYDASNAEWTEAKMQQYGGNLTWMPHTHDYTVQGVGPTCTEKGFATYTCNTCGYYFESGSDFALGHNMGDWVQTEPPTCVGNGMGTRYCSRCEYSEIQHTPPAGHTWTDTAEEGIHTCTVCGLTEGAYRLWLPDNTPDGIESVWVDGVEYPILTEKSPYIAVTHPNGTSLSLFKYKNAESEDIHTQYPSVMYTWLIRWSDSLSRYSVIYVHNLFHYSILSYAGSSIRIKGVKGIRMITGVHEITRNALTGEGLIAGNHVYKLVEYGTLLAWAKDLEGGNPLTLGQSYVKSNYAYKRGVADPIYSRDSQYVYYTNVLVGFNNDQCKDDIAMRPYLIMEDETGRRVTIYGGIVYRSIGYIAYQNRNAFKPGNASYDYVWDIIHHVYGDQYDNDYKG